MESKKEAPHAYHRFVESFPKLGECWELMRAAEAEACTGQDDGTRRLLKLAIAVGALREGAVKSSARKARAAGVSEADIEQVVALAASTIGMPASVAVHCWIHASKG